MILNTSFAYAPNKLNYIKESFTEAKKYSIDYLQIQIIESGKNSCVVSIAGAVGDMQIMPITLEDWNKNNKSEQYDMDDMYVEAKNIKVGRWMLEKRIPEILTSEKVPITITNVLIAYNWGCGNLVKWYKKGAQISKLPKETQQYICKYWVKF
jgi:soluble lytic murein transglycosylase-like protein